MNYRSAKRGTETQFLLTVLLLCIILIVVAPAYAGFDDIEVTIEGSGVLRGGEIARIETTILNNGTEKVTLDSIKVYAEEDTFVTGKKYGLDLKPIAKQLEQVREIQDELIEIIRKRKILCPQCSLSGIVKSGDIAQLVEGLKSAQRWVENNTLTEKFYIITNGLDSNLDNEIDLSLFFKLNHNGKEDVLIREFKVKRMPPLQRMHASPSWYWGDSMCTQSIHAFGSQILLVEYSALYLRVRMKYPR
jgi:hypothetical protein